MKSRLRIGGSAVLILMAVALLAGAGAVQVSAAGPLQRYIVVAKGATDFASLASDVQAASGRIVAQLPELNAVVVVAPSGSFESSIKGRSHVGTVAKDHIEHLIQPNLASEFGFNRSGQQQRFTVSGTGAVSPALAPPSDPASGLPGLMWNLDRIGIPAAWNGSLGGGDPSVTVGVEDTGVDYTHFEMKNKIAGVKDFTVNEDPNICSTFFSLPTDAQLATAFATNPDEDFNGHGSWIAGNIAGHIDGTGTPPNAGGINGIAPGVSIYSLKIAQNCGSAYDSTMLEAVLFAANQGIDIVSISFGGYLDRSDPDQDLIYKMWTSAVKYAMKHGTTIVAAAGNEHARIGAGGLVLSHGILDVPPGGTDEFGQWENPGGIPGVVDVSSTGNVVNGSSASCPVDSLAATSHQWCKPSSDAHQPTGVGTQNQLAYYSNYGPRIDIAAPGGARKFNLPSGDRGGCEGWPWCGTLSVEGGTSVSDGYNAWETFSMTSNFATEIPCFTFTGDPVFPDNNCYAIIQGTSMATPHVSAALALVATAFPKLRHKPDKLVARLKATAQHVTGNKTKPLSKTDTSPPDLGGGACPGGYCHLGGSKIPDAEAYGAGLLDANAAVHSH